MRLVKFSIDDPPFSVQVRLSPEEAARTTVAEIAAKAVAACRIFFPACSSLSLAGVLLHGDEVAVSALFSALPPELELVARVTGADAAASMTRVSSRSKSMTAIPHARPRKPGSNFSRLFARRASHQADGSTHAAPQRAQIPAPTPSPVEPTTVAEVLRDKAQLAVLLQVATHAFCPSDVEAAALMRQHAQAVEEGKLVLAHRIADNVVRDFLGPDVTLSISLGLGENVKERVAAGEWSDASLFSTMVAELSMYIKLRLWEPFLVALAMGATSSDSVICFVCEARSCASDHRCSACKLLTCSSCIRVVRTQKRGASLLCLNCIKCRVCKTRTVKREHYCGACERQTCGPCLSVDTVGENTVAICKDCSRTENAVQRARASTNSLQWHPPRMLSDRVLGAWLLSAKRKTRRSTRHFIECRLGILVLHSTSLKGSIVITVGVHSLVRSPDSLCVEVRKEGTERLLKIVFQSASELADFEHRCDAALLERPETDTLFYYVTTDKGVECVLRFRGARIKLWSLKDREEVVLRDVTLETSEAGDSNGRDPFCLTVACWRRTLQLGSVSPLEIIHVMQTIRSASSGNPELEIPVSPPRPDFAQIQVLAQAYDQEQDANESESAPTKPLSPLHALSQMPPDSVSEFSQPRKSSVPGAESTNFRQSIDYTKMPEESGDGNGKWDELF